MYLFTGLQNDHKDLMKSIEQCLYKIHADARDHGNEDVQTTSFPKPAARPTSPEKKPFAKVDRVDAGSPSAAAVSIEHRLRLHGHWLVLLAAADQFHMKYLSTVFFDGFKGY